MTPKKFRDASKTVKILAIVPAVIITIAVAILLIFAYSGQSVTVGDGQIVISGIYGQTVRFDEVTDITLIEKSMSEISPSLTRTNGVGGFGQTLIGYFTGSVGEVMLFVMSKTAPTIWIECEGRRDIYISFGDSQKTRDLYAEMKGAVS